MGAPPHGGIALGIDRMTMVLAGEPNLRDVIAFPKNQAGLDPMSGAPTRITTGAARRARSRRSWPRSMRAERARRRQRLLALAAVALLAGLVAVAVVEQSDDENVQAPRREPSPPAAGGTTPSPRRDRRPVTPSGRAAGSCSRPFARRDPSGAPVRREGARPVRRRHRPHRGDRQRARRDRPAVRAHAGARASSSGSTARSRSSGATRLGSGCPGAGRLGCVCSASARGLGLST